MRGEESAIEARPLEAKQVYRDNAEQERAEQEIWRQDSDGRDKFYRLCTP